MRHAEALKVAESLAAHFGSVCERIEIAGSIRRLKPEVKDIELLAVPDLTPPPRPKLEFGKPLPIVYKTALDQLIAQMEADHAIIMEKGGDRYKKFYLKPFSISVDLFLVHPPATWGVQKVIRTGPYDFSHWVVTRRRHGGALPNGYRVQDGAVWEGERHVRDLVGQTLIGFEEEKDFLEFLGLGWIEPQDRVARWKWTR